MLRLTERYSKFCFLSRHWLHSSQNGNEGQKSKNYKRKVKETVELINLIGTDNQVMGLKPKTDSEKLARKLNLTLQKINDPRFGKTYPVYKLMSSSDFFKEEVTPSSKKSLKKLPLNSRISENDLKIKFQTIEKWISKNCEVHVVVMGKDDTEHMRKNLLKKTEDYFKGKSRLIDIRSGEDALKFILIPPKKTVETAENEPVPESSEKTDEKAN